MQSAILDKLSRHLEKPPATEADVVYALVQVRKFLEREKSGSSFGHITFFCDWAAHTSLSYANTQELLRIVDAFIDSEIGAITLPRSVPERRCFEIFSLQGLRHGLLDFCRTYGLPEDWTASLKTWFPVASMYASIIQDCPLVAKDGGVPTKFISDVILTASITPDWSKKQEDRRKYVSITWELKMKRSHTIAVICTLSDVGVGVAYPRHEFKKLRNVER